MALQNLNTFNSMQQPDPNQQQKKLSGQFTNLKNYIQGNQQATQRLTNQLTGQQTTQGQQLQQKSQTQADSVRAGVEAAKTNIATAGQATGFAAPQPAAQQPQPQNNQPNVTQVAPTQQTPSVTYTPEQLAAMQNDATKIATFQNVLQGNVVDETALANQQAQALSAQAAGQQGVQNLYGQTTNSNLRMQALADIVGNRASYGFGNQALDQSMVQVGGREQLGKAQESLRTNLRDIMGLSGSLEDYNKNIGDLAKQEALMQSTVGTGLESSRDALAKNLFEQTASYNKDMQSVLDRLKSGTATQADVEKLTPQLQTMGLDTNSMLYDPNARTQLINALGRKEAGLGSLVTGTQQGAMDVLSKLNRGITDVNLLEGLKQTDKGGLTLSDQFKASQQEAAQRSAKYQDLTNQIKSRQAAAEGITGIASTVMSVPEELRMAKLDEIAKEANLDQGTLDYLKWGLQTNKFSGRAVHDFGQDFWRQSEQLAAEASEFQPYQTGVSLLDLLTKGGV